VPFKPPHDPQGTNPSTALSGHHLLPMGSSHPRAAQRSMPRVEAHGALVLADTCASSSSAAWEEKAEPEFGGLMIKVLS